MSDPSVPIIVDGEPVGWIFYRERWPVGTQPRVSLAARQRQHDAVLLEIAPLKAGGNRLQRGSMSLDWFHSVTADPSFQWFEGTEAWPLVNGNAAPAAFTYWVFHDDGERKEPRAQGTLSIPYSPVATVDEALPAADAAECDLISEALRHAFSPSGTTPTIELRSPEGLKTKVAVGIRVEWLQDGQPKGRASAHFSGGEWRINSRLDPDTEIRLTKEDILAGRWAVHISDDPVAALAELGAAKRWRGDVRINLKECATQAYLDNLGGAERESR